ncbi:MAG: M23 family metallopeptidase [Oscillospiraceae bacterium]|nr:M23 family metallopeptidase [Oscillospiraceae bacterium]
MSNNKHTGRGVFGKGYYIALILCAAAIGISGYLYYRNANETEASLQEPDADQVEVPANADQNEDVPAVATQPQGTETATQGTDATTAPTAAGSIKTGMPVEGTTVAGYAMDCLSYNETTRDWRVHNGVDIAAEEGTPVLAAADGVVYTTYSDDAMGTTVVIRHDGGYTTKYSSLAEELSVKTGDTVELGQAIGCVGSTALIENAIGPHVHFTVTYRDAEMDPMEFLNMDA